jgi:repressor LexA
MERGKHTEFENKLKESIAKNLKALLKEKRISQRELSELTDIPTSTINDYVNAKSLAIAGNVQKIAFALKVSKDRIDPSFADDLPTPLDKAPSKIPLVGTICAGDGFPPEEYIEEYIHYPFESKRQPDYALRVKGHSMINVGIEDGDIVYLRRASWAERNGQVVAAIVNGEEGTLKRMKWSGSSPMITLQPENDDFQVIEVMPNEITVCGIYMGHFKMDKEE